MKNSIVEVQSFISYQLSQLNSKNEHHRFEDMCRQFARLRIAENIIPATGPVSAGGDQGRDFESYKTYLSSTPIATSTFLAKISTHTLVFACSLNKKPESKIKNDLSVIFKNNPSIERIYYFSNQNIPVAKRHQLEQFAMDTYKTALTIFDLFALAENLSTIDVFWIAQEYLAIPANIYPRIQESNGKYEEYKNLWLDNNLKPETHSDFFQIQYGLREATFNANEKIDLPAWINKMEYFANNDRPNSFSRKALYEIAVAALRGLNNIFPYQERIANYFSNIQKLEAIDDIEDAVNLLIYCLAANRLSHSNFEDSLISNWRIALISQIELLLKRHKELNTPSFNAYLLMLRGHIEVACVSDSKEKKEALNNLLKWWRRAVTEIKKSPLFPLLRFSNLLNILIPLFGQFSDFNNFIKIIDELLASRAGMNTIAENCCNRAIAHYEARNYIQAIKELHTSKINWFSAETIESSLFAILTIADCYIQLNLIYAAKYSLLSAIYIINHTNDNQIKRLLFKALFNLAECNYKAGEWISFMHVAKLTLLANAYFKGYSNDQLDENDINQIIIYFFKIKVYMPYLHPKILPSLESLFLEWPLEQEFKDMLQSDFEIFQKEYVQSEALLQKIPHEFLGKPFCELGEIRTIYWEALGIKWCLYFKNNYDLGLIVEHMAAILQIVIADLADIDLCLLPTIVDIEIDINDKNELIFKEKPNNLGTSLIILFPKCYIELNQNKNINTEIESTILGLALFILNKCSMLPEKEVRKIIDKAMKNDLPNKAFIGMTYADCYKEIIPKDYLEKLVKIDQHLLDSIVLNSIEASQLSWNQSLGTGYSKNKAEKFLKNRYKNSIKSIRLTLAKAIKNPDFNNQITILKSKGLLDWQILLIIMNIVLNYRSHQMGLTSQEELLLFQKEHIYREEKETDIEIPINLLIQYLQDSLYEHTTFSATTKIWDLQIKQSTPDGDAIKKLLDAKYLNSSDDIEHEDFFHIS